MSNFVERITMESREKYDAVDFSPTAKLPRIDFHFNCAGASIGTLLPFNVFGYYLLYFYIHLSALLRRPPHSSSLQEYSIPLQIC